MTTRVRVIPIKLKKRAPTRVQTIAALTKAVTDTVVSGRTFISTYPPQRLTATGYRRTGTLARSWSFRVTARSTSIVGVVGSNSNIAPYNREVQGKNQGFLFDRAGWSDVQDLAKKMEKDLARNARAAIRRTLR